MWHHSTHPQPQRIPWYKYNFYPQVSISGVCWVMRLSWDPAHWVTHWSIEPPPFILVTAPHCSQLSPGHVSCHSLLCRHGLKCHKGCAVEMVHSYLTPGDVTMHSSVRIPNIYGLSSFILWSAKTHKCVYFMAAILWSRNNALIVRLM